MDKILSVVLITYEQKKYLKDCIMSVLEQDYSMIELIVSDDSSSDFEVKEIEKFIKKNKKNNLVNYKVNKNSENIGPVRNLNKAIMLSTGDYIMNLDGDDMLYDKTAISSLVNFFNTTEYLAVTALIKFYDENMEHSSSVYPSEEIYNYMLKAQPFEVYKRLCRGDFLAGPGFSYKRELIEKYGLYDENYKVIADYSRYLQLTRNGCKIGMIDKIIIKYRKNVGVWSSSKHPNDPKKIKIRNMVSGDMKLIAEREVKPYQ